MHKEYYNIKLRSRKKIIAENQHKEIIIIDEIDKMPLKDQRRFTDYDGKR